MGCAVAVRHCVAGKARESSAAFGGLFMGEKNDLSEVAFILHS